MKIIINGKIYDTDTAKELAGWANEGGWRDFRHMEETLYRKKTGELFLHGAGGPMTKYAEPTGQNGWRGGERIMPMTFDEARQWAEEKLSADEYEKIFGEVTEDDSRQQICLSLSASTIETLRRRAAELGLTVSAYVDKIVAEA